MKSTKAGPGDLDVIINYDEAVPEAGSEEFQKFIADKYKVALISEAMSNPYVAGEGIDASFGNYGSISYEDYNKLGQPKKIGDHRVIGDAGNGFLITINVEDKSHGIERALNDIGGMFGYDRMGKDFMHTMNDSGQFPIFGPVANEFMSPINAYENARDAGKSSASAGHEAGKAGIQALGDAAIAAAQVALVVAAVAAAIPTGGASLAALPAMVGAGAAAGAAGGFAGGAARHGITSVLYGGETAETAYGGDIWETAGKSSASGAITGAATGIAAGLFPTAFAGSAGTAGVFVPTSAAEFGAASVMGGGQALAASSVYGAEGRDLINAAVGGFLSAGGTMSKLNTGVVPNSVAAVRAGGAGYAKSFAAALEGYAYENAVARKLFGLPKKVIFSDKNRSMPGATDRVDEGRLGPAQMRIEELLGQPGFMDRIYQNWSGRGHFVV